MDTRFIVAGDPALTSMQETEITATTAETRTPELYARPEVTDFDPSNIGHLALIGIIAGTSAAITWLNLRRDNR